MKDEMTSKEMTLALLQVIDLPSEGVDFEAKNVVTATDYFAMDNGYYFFPHLNRYKKID